MGFRKLWLINALGNKYEFTNQNSRIFLDSPEGLGFTRVYSSTRLGNVEVIDTTQFEMIDVGGDLLFHEATADESYQRYNEFIQFIKYKPLELHYQTPNSLEDYFCKILITSVEKSQVSSSDSVLHCPITMHRLTQWLTTNDYVVELKKLPTEDGKFYELERPYYYAGNTLQNVSLTNSGTDAVGFTFQIDGEVTNPQFTMSQNGEVYGVCKLNGTFDFVRVNSVDDEEEIYLENDGSSLANPSAYQDLTTTDGESYITFIKLAVGENIFNFTCGNIDTFDGTITIRFKNSYVSV